MGGGYWFAHVHMYAERVAVSIRKAVFGSPSNSPSPTAWPYLPWFPVSMTDCVITADRRQWVGLIHCGCASMLSKHGGREKPLNAFTGDYVSLFLQYNGKGPVRNIFPQLSLQITLNTAILFLQYLCQSWHAFLSLQIILFIFLYIQTIIKVWGWLYFFFLIR